MSLVTGHKINDSALTPFYIAKDGALDVLMLMAGFGAGLDHRSFSCNKHYIQGRHLFTSADIQSAYPEIWALISAQLLPGLDELLSALTAKPVRSKDETRQLRLATVCFNLREAFLQDSAWHFFDPLYTPVFAGLSLYRIEAFVQWLTETFRPELTRLQTEADAVSKYICGFYPGSSSLLDRSLDALGIDRASTAPESRRLLHEMHKRMLQDKAGLALADSTAVQQQQQQQQQAMPPLVPQLTTSVYMPPLRAYSGVELLLKMYSAWHKGDPRLGILPLKATHSAGCPYYRGAFYGGEKAAKSTRSAITNNKAMLTFFYSAVQRRAALVKVRVSEKMDTAAKQVAQEWWDKIQQHPHMKSVADMARCCQQVVSKHQAGVQTHLGETSKKRDADGDVSPKLVYVMPIAAFCQYFDLN